MNLSTCGDFDLIALLRCRGSQLPSHRAFTFLADGKTETVQLTFGALLARAQAIAANLQSRSAPGDRALLLFPSGLEFIPAFFGCILADVIAVPTYPPRRNRPDHRLQVIVDDAQATCALTTSEVLSDLDGWCAHTPQLRKLDWLATDAVDSIVADAWRPPLVHADSLAFLQYTSGSTSSPKGVMVSHGNLLHTLRDLDRGFEHTDASVMVSWLPTFHDLGLIYGILMPIYRGFPCYLIPPAVFLQRPCCWLEAISRYQATHSAAPNFAYELCAAKITDDDRQRLDLSSWKMTLNAAEPVREETLQRFASALQPCGFDFRAMTPGYGLAEASLKVTSDRAGRRRVSFDVDADALAQHRVVAADAETLNRQSLVGCGQSEVGTRIAIVDPETSAVSSADRVGEVWVAGACVAQGYWNQPDQTQMTFQARLSDSGEGPFLRTGDLGFVRDGQLYLTGRLKDLIIIRGLNHYPQDIELTVECCDEALRAGCGAAFSIEFGGEERLVVVQEVKRTANPRDLDLPAIGAAIRQSIAESHDLQVHAIALLRTGSIAKTSSGKIQRRACRAGFLDGSLKVIWQWREADVDVRMKVASGHAAPPPATLTTPSSGITGASLRTVLAPWLQVPASQIDIDEPFVRYGIDSITAVRISGELAAWLDRPLSPTLLYDYPTVRSLALFLARPDTQFVPATLTRAHRWNESIAIVGMGCRFPGADNPRAFWKLLSSGVDAVTEVPASRWDADQFYDPAPGTIGKMSSRWGGFLAQVDQFDADFFGISRSEAELMDPQQRLLLEITWEALENAGEVNLAGTRTGVFVGISNFDYWRLIIGQPAATSAHAGTGNALSIAANRLSYYFDLHGPSLAIDTACSSSLVAIHQACESLRHGQCEAAIAGGVNLILSPDLTIAFSQARMLSPAGRCKTFDANADGYVRGEGCGVVVLKRLADARRDNNRILAIIRGSAVNQDGRSNGLTAPNGRAQQAVIREALASAGIAARRVSYIEAHGTGTSLGDPIELNSLVGVLGEERATHQRCWVGSVKTNIGHLEAAAGIAGLIKVVLTLQHRQLPPHLHLTTLNPHIALNSLPLSIPTELTAWPDQGDARVAGVSSFGFGGTNAHVVLEEAPNAIYCDTRGGISRHAPASGFLEIPGKPDASAWRLMKRKAKVDGIEESPPNGAQANAPDRPSHLLTLSARSDTALREACSAWRDHLQSHEEPLSDVCFTASTGRSHFHHRLAVIANSREELVHRLTAVANGTPIDDASTTAVHGETDDRFTQVAFLFTGQGSQYVNMGRELFASQPVFREALERCDEILRSQREQSLLSVLYPERHGASPLDETEWCQPALFALEYALSELWKSWGIIPCAVLGHSVGEYAAACVAGVLELPDALKLVAERGALMQRLPRDGLMAAVAAGVDRVEPLLQGYQDSVSIAAVNGPGLTVISGARDRMAQVLELLDRDGIAATRLNTSHAFHSPLIEPALDGLAAVAANLPVKRPMIPLIANLTGELADAKFASPEYWRRQARHPVQFAQGMRKLRELGCRVFVEIGPSPVLLGMGRTCLSADGECTLWLPSLRRGGGDWQQMLQSLSQLYVRGAAVDWTGFDRPFARHRLELPTYPFARKRYWIAPAAVGDTRRSSNADVDAGHPLLGKRRSSPVPRDEVEFTCRLSPQRPSYLQGHRVFGETLLPLSAYLEMALGAGREVFGDRAFAIESLDISRPVVLSDRQATAVHVVLSPQPTGYRFQVFSAAPADGNSQTQWTLHAEAVLALQPVHAEPDSMQVRTQRRFCEFGVAAFYAECRRRGIDSQSTVSALRKLWRGESEALAEIRLPESLAAARDDYQFHPVLLDACLHTAAAAMPAADDEAWLLAGVERMQLIAPSHLARQVWARLRATSTESSRLADLRVLADDGKIVASIDGLRMKRAHRQSLLDPISASLRDDLYELEWVQQDHAAASAVASPRETISRLSAGQSCVRDPVELTEFGHALAHIEEICASLAWQSLRQPGWPPRMGERFLIAEMVQRLGVAARCEPLFVRLLTMFENEGLLRHDGNAWEVIGLVNGRDARSALYKTGQQYPSVEVVVDLLQRCASGLPSVLRGELDPTELLFPGGDLTSLTRLYQDSAPAAAMNELVAAAVAAAVADLPADTKLRVLEIGAGTGATSSYVLPKLPMERTEYVLTDVDGKLLDAARDRFRGYGFLSCELLNIEQDADAQGFAGRSFDLVLAANVLHATRDLRESLENVRKLLAPGGLLLLLEGTQPLRCLDLTFGLTEAWWKFRDRSLRPSHPLISADQWLRLLSDAGWQDAAAIPGDIDDARRRMHQILFVAGRPRSPVAHTASAGRWLILADGTDRGRRLMELLQAGGQHCTLISSRELSDCDRLLERSIGGRERLLGVVHFAIPDARAIAGTNGDDLSRACQTSCRAALLLVQALVRAELPHQPRLWLVTRGAIDGRGLHKSEGERDHGGDDDALAIAQSTAWGLGKVIAREHSEFQCVLVDLDPAVDSDEVLELYNELHATDRPLEGQVVLRKGCRFAARLVRSRAPVKPQRMVIHPDRTYLITGGLGAIGLEVARWLVDRGARHLLLLGRSGPSGAAQSAVEQFQRDGVEVVCRSADVSQYQQLADVLEDSRRQLPPLVGVFHLAGVFADRLVVDHSWELFEEVFAPKVSGAWNLHRLTRGCELEIFVLFSSASTLLGTTGVANYVAANHFLDSLAVLRRGQGLPGLSINWGPWEQLGMARSAAGERMAEWSAMGMQALHPSQALNALNVVLDLDTPQVAVISIDWSRLGAHPAAKSYGRLLGSLLEPTHRPQSLRQQIASAPANHRRAMLASHVIALVGRVLGVAPGETLSMKRGFFDLGMDSLRATALRNFLQTDFDCALSSTLTFKFPNVQALVEHLGETVFGISGQPSHGRELALPRPADSTETSQRGTETNAANVLQEVAAELAQLEELLRVGS